MQLSKLMASALCALSLSTSYASSEDLPKELNAEGMRALCLGTFAGVSEQLQAGLCSARLQGVAETMQLNCQTIPLGQKPSKVLTAANVPSSDALKHAFLTYVNAHPQHWGTRWSSVVALAVSESFPCDQ